MLLVSVISEFNTMSHSRHLNYRRSHTQKDSKGKPLQSMERRSRISLKIDSQVGRKSRPIHYSSKGRGTDRAAFLPPYYTISVNTYIHHYIWATFRWDLGLRGYFLQIQIIKDMHLFLQSHFSPPCSVPCCAIVALLVCPAS
jgi:hypothetical protein